MSELGADEAARRVHGAGLTLRCGPFTVRARSPFPAVAQGIALMYADYPLAGDGEFADFHVVVGPPRGPRRWVRPQATFVFDGTRPFEPLPRAHAYPLFEWGLNWCIASHAHQYLILHAAAVERGGHVAVIPGKPGSGKSTLCAGLVGRGWRLLTDELTLVEVADGRLWPLARPLSLKNRSIEVIARFVPEAVLNTPLHDTVKGTVTQMRVPAAHVQRMHEPAAPGWVIFPHYEAGAPVTLSPRSKADSMLELGRNAFNYALHARRGFECLADLVDASGCFDFRYGDLEEAVRLFEKLRPGGGPG